MRGSEGLGRNATDRGYNSRKGLKVSLICDTNRIVKAVHLEHGSKANTHELAPAHQTFGRNNRPDS